jgi:hypothetical protein
MKTMVGFLAWLFCLSSLVIARVSAGNTPMAADRYN